MMSLIFGILGAVAAALYWRYSVYVGASVWNIEWTPDGRAVLLYAIVGFVIGWFVGFAFGKLRSEDHW